MSITKQQVLENIDTVKKYIEEAESEKKEEKTFGICIKTVLGSVLFQSTKSTIKEAVIEAKNSGANLCGANLRGADLCDADLCGANLCDANLCGADLCGADLCGANLRGAELCDAKFYGRGGTKKITKAQLPDFLNALGFQIEE
jgi:uncharacterized protein YjbI with pentapeptide repeats